MQIELGHMESGSKVIFHPEEAINSHILCLGASGCGKTVEAQKIMTEIVRQRGTVLAISVHSSLAKDQIFKGYADDFEQYGRHVFAQADGIPCEMFSKETYQDGTVERECNLVDAIAGVISSTYNLGWNERIILADAVEKVLENQCFQTEGFRSVGQQLQKQDRSGARMLYERLKSLFAYNIIHNGSLIEQEKLNVIHLDHLDVTTQQTVAELLLAYIWRKANADAFKKHELWVFLDECQNYDAGKKGALPLLISEGRKMGINLILATQVMTGSSKNAMEERILQCDTKLLFKPSENRQIQTAKIAGGENYKQWIPVMSKLRRGEFVVCGKKKVGSYIVDYPIKVSARDELHQEYS